MAIKSITEAELTDKKVLIRMDFNVELDDLSGIQEHFKLEVGKKTLDHILSCRGTRVALLTHFGRPQGKDPQYSVARLAPFIEQALGYQVALAPDCIGETVEQALALLPEKSVLLLENVRYYPEEEANDRAFSEKLAAPFDVYVNEAFSACHRSHASIVGVPAILPSYAGFRLLEEVTQLDRVILEPKRPAIAIIGGAKIETKLPLIRALEVAYDAVLVGGKIANEAVDQGLKFSEKTLLPVDFVSPLRLDIGPNTVAYYTQIIKTGKTIIWNGPLGKFEEKPYDIGTEAILHAILETDAFVVIGGGESLAILEHANVMNKVGFVSSGGGAMLDYLSDRQLPGLTALET